jgi:DNA-binding XRE family transcriptional regulator
MSTTTPAMSFTLGDALRKSRTQPMAGAKLSQEAMAERLHVSRPTIGAWEKGKAAPPFWAVAAWADLTGWPMEWFEESARQTAPLIHGLTSSVQPRLFEYAASPMTRPGPPLGRAA